jgi:hypothetical protein
MANNQYPNTGILLINRDRGDNAKAPNLEGQRPGYDRGR